MSKKSWVITVIPLVIYLISFGFTIITEKDLSEDQLKLLEGMLYAFIGSGAIGTANVCLKRTKLK